MFGKLLKHEPDPFSGDSSNSVTTNVLRADNTESGSDLGRKKKSISFWWDIPTSWDLVITGFKWDIFPHVGLLAPVVAERAQLPSIEAGNSPDTLKTWAM